MEHLLWDIFISLSISSLPSPREVGAKGFTFIDSEIAGSEQGGDSPKTHSL